MQKYLRRINPDGMDTRSDAGRIPERDYTQSFFVADSPEGFPAATGFLDVENASVEAIFTRPGFEGKGLATKILNAIKAEAKSLGFSELTLSSTPNAFEFYKRNGFCLVKESVYRSELANASLLCMDMRCEL